MLRGFGPVRSAVSPAAGLGWRFPSGAGEWTVELTNVEVSNESLATSLCDFLRRLAERRTGDDCPPVVRIPTRRRQGRARRSRRFADKDDVS